MARDTGRLWVVTSAPRNMCSANSIRPIPIATRPRSRVRVLPPRLNAITPANSRTGVTAVMLNDRICTTSVVPTLAPSMTARAGTRSKVPPVTNDAAINPVAVLLWSRAVTKAPARNVRNRLCRAIPSRRRRSAPNARTTPLWTMCNPQSSSATPPIKSKMTALPMYARLPGQRVGLGIAEALHGFQHPFLVAQSRVLDASERRHLQPIARHLAHVHAADLELAHEAADEIDAIGAKRR